MSNGDWRRSSLRNTISYFPQNAKGFLGVFALRVGRGIIGVSLNRVGSPEAYL